MVILLTVVHIVSCLFLLLVVLLQAGRGAGLSGIFGGGGGEALFSAPSGSAFLRKLTTAVAIIFLSTSLLLTIFSTRQREMSITEKVPEIPVEAPPVP